MKAVLYDIWIVAEAEIETVAEIIRRPKDELRRLFLDKLSKGELCFIQAYLTDEQVQEMRDRKPVITTEQWVRALEGRRDGDEDPVR